MNYYNEIDPKKAAWLRELIARGVVADGEVDERSIEDVVPTELAGYTQCHFFAGIGLWSYALRLAGWPDDRPVWTGSCPCQSFSAAGKGAGFADERHLWPAWFHLISECRPDRIFGEQVGAAIGHGWLDLVHDDLEAVGYTLGSVVLPACSVGAPHLRQRLWFVAHRTRTGLEGATRPSLQGRGNGSSSGSSLVAHAEDERQGGGADAGRGGTEGERERALRGESVGSGEVGELGNACGPGPQGHGGPGRLNGAEGREGQGRHSAEAGVDGFWSDCEWLPCTDGKARPVGRGIQPLVQRMANAELRGCESGRLRVGNDGTESQRAIHQNGGEGTGSTQPSPEQMADGPAPGVLRGGDCLNTPEERVLRLKGYGDGIVPQVAAEVIRASMEEVRA